MSLLLYTIAAGAPIQAKTVEPPRILDPEWRIELVACEPELVTPVACEFDSQGRLYVVECHTHFPPDDYQGPDVDRIYRFEDSNADGKPDRKQLFFEGGAATMGLASLSNDWLAVATRSNVYRVRDQDGDGKAEQVEELLRLETEATYPHNGLAEVVLGPDGWLYVGQGENLGEPYALVGRDGSRQVGGGEGGNVFRCQPDGTKLERYATGFWNPFGLTFDTADRLWAVGNDPDAMPPCRLLHVVETGDYGFQFRFGRAGTNPLQSWDGEFPGTLGMAAGTGEAPCSVLQHDGALWVTTWGSNRVERYRLNRDGASWQSTTEVVVQGNAQFRPVDMAVDGSGSIYLTDWVDRSYPVHGKGRLWRLSRRNADAADQRDRYPRLSELEIRSDRLAGSNEVTLGERLEALKSNDAFVRQAAIAGLIESDQLPRIRPADLDQVQQKVSLLAAWRWLDLIRPEGISKTDRQQWIRWGLDQPSAETQLSAIRWATSRSMRQMLPPIRKLLDQDSLSPDLFEASVAAVAYLQSGSAARGKRDPERERLLYEFAADPKRPLKLRSLAVQLLPAEAQQPDNHELLAWTAQNSDRRFGGELVRLLAAREDATSRAALVAIASSRQLDPQVRADAVAALGSASGTRVSAATQISLKEEDEVVRTAIERYLSGKLPETSRDVPAADDLQAWLQLLGDGGDVQAGRRVFFASTCADCHTHSGRGADVGPDLTSIAGEMPRERILESIMQPSKEVGPLYVPWKVVTTDGRLLVGMRLDAAGVGRSVRYLNSDGTVFEVALEEIEQQQPTEQSIMPQDLHKTLTVGELRDLLAFLGNPRW